MLYLYVDKLIIKLSQTTDINCHVSNLVYDFSDSQDGAEIRKLTTHACISGVLIVALNDG